MELECAQDCFACLEEQCTVLEEAMQPCPFRADTEEYKRRLWKSYHQLITEERFDLIRKYRQVLDELGLFAPEWRQIDDMKNTIAASAEQLFPLLKKPVDETQEDDESEEESKRPVLLEKEAYDSQGFPEAELNAEMKHQQETKGEAYISIQSQNRWRPDPITEGYALLGANIVYTAAEDYITALRFLHASSVHADERLDAMVDKIEIESFFGSWRYWQIVNISPRLILDQCWRIAIGQEKKVEEDLRRWMEGLTD